MTKAELILEKNLTKQKIRLLLNQEMSFDEELSKQPEYAIYSQRYADLYEAFDREISEEIKYLSEIYKRVQMTN